MKLIKLPQIERVLDGWTSVGDIFINPEHVVAVDPNVYGRAKPCCDVLLHTQGLAVISLPAEKVAELLGANRTA
jgi:hypothetical protein